MEAVTDKWGIRINRIEIVEITPPPQILQALALQKQADQEKRAKILQSEGTQQSAVNVADGDRQAAIKSAEGERQSAILRAEGNRQAAILEAEGRAQAIADGLLGDHRGEPESDARRDPPARHAEPLRREPEHEDRHPGRVGRAAGCGPGDPVRARPGPARDRIGPAATETGRAPDRSVRRRWSRRSGRPSRGIEGAAGASVASSAAALPRARWRAALARLPHVAMSHQRRRLRPRRVVEDPVAVLAAADLDPLGVTRGQLGHERIGQARQRVVDRIADVAMVDVDAVARGDELDDLAGVERAVDRLE